MQIDGLLPPGGCAQGAAEDGDGGGGGKLVAVGGPSGSPGPDTTTGGVAALTTATVVHKERRALVGTIGVAAAYVGGPAGSTAELTSDDNGSLALAMMHAFDVYYDLAPKAAHLVFEVNVRRTTLALDSTTIPTPANPPLPATTRRVRRRGATRHLRRSDNRAVGRASAGSSRRRPLATRPITRTPHF